jgi:hypothetical protein
MARNPHTDQEERMGKLRIAPKPRTGPAKDAASDLSPLSILNWETTDEDDPQRLARYARQAALLAQVAVRGSLDIEKQIGSPTDDLEYLTICELLGFTELLCRQVAKKLGVEKEVA